MALSNRAKTGQPALKALAHAMGTVCSGVYANRNKEWIDIDARRIAKELTDLGFIIIPERYSPPARRGEHNVNPGFAAVCKDVWIGKSHSAKLVDGG